MGRGAQMKAERLFSATGVRRRLQGPTVKTKNAYDDHTIIHCPPVCGKPAIETAVGDKFPE